MPTIKLELYKSKILSNGKHPVCITVTHKGKRIRKSIGSVNADEWDSKNAQVKSVHRKDLAKVAKLNREYQDELDKYKVLFKVLSRSGKEWVAEDVFSDQVKATEYFLFNSNLYLESVIGKSIFTYNTWRSFHRKVSAFAEGRDFEINEIDTFWVEGFISYCQTQGNSHNTIMNTLKYIKRIAKRSFIQNRALERIKITNEKKYKEKLTTEELLKFSQVELTPGTHIYHTQKTFLLQFYLRGMRIGDLLQLQASDIIGDRLKYDATKTGKEYDMKLIPEAVAILSEYLDRKGDYVLPWLRIKPMQQTTLQGRTILTEEIKNRTAVINYHLKAIAKKAGIIKNISTHIARHSFAALGDQKLGGDLKKLQALLGHGSRKMTEIYIRDLRKSKDMDDDADTVFN